MKRGYMDWNQVLLPQGQLKQRQAEFIKKFAALNIDAAVVYGDVASADELQYLTNLGPYFFYVAGVFFKDGRVRLVTGLSGRVNPWISKMTGLDNSQIIAAGPKFNVKVADVLKEQLGGTSVIGVAGKYLPQELEKSLEGTGFKLLAYQEPINEQLVKRDASYLATLKQGTEIMNGAIKKVLQNPEIKKMTRKRVAAEVEYSCRTAGAMDIMILTGDEQLIFDQPLEVLDNSKPWTLYLQIQYLGEWLVVARNIEGGPSEDIKTARDKVALTLKPGSLKLAWNEDGYSFKVNTKVVSDHLFEQDQDHSVLYEDQVVSLTVMDKRRGQYLEEMYRVSAKGGQQLFCIS